MSSWSSDDNKLVEFFRIHMLLTPLRLVLVLQYLTSPSFMVLRSLVYYLETENFITFRFHKLLMETVILDIIEYNTFAGNSDFFYFAI